MRADHEKELADLVTAYNTHIDYYSQSSIYNYVANYIDGDGKWKKMSSAHLYATKLLRPSLIQQSVDHGRNNIYTPLGSFPKRLT